MYYSTYRVLCYSVLRMLQWYYGNSIYNSMYGYIKDVHHIYEINSLTLTPLVHNTPPSPPPTVYRRIKTYLNGVSRICPPFVYSLQTQIMMSANNMDSIGTGYMTKK